MENKVSILYTSDSHGYWLKGVEEEEVNLIASAQLIQSLKEQRQHPVLALDLGDFIQGSSFATYLQQIHGQGEVLSRAMNVIGYNYQVLGNHEFNFGPEYVRDILSQLDSKLLNANILEEATGQPLIGQAYDIVELAGLKLGIIGATTSYIPNWELPEHIEGIRFADAFEQVAYYVEAIRDQVDVLVVAYHGGFERDLDSFELTEFDRGENQGSRMLAQIPGIDILLTGHQHRVLNQRVGDTWVMQPGAYGQYVGEIIIDKTGGQLELTGILHPNSGLQATTYEAELQELMQPELSQGQAWLDQIVGQAPLKPVNQETFQARVKGHPYLALLNDLQLKESGADFSAVTLVNEHYADFRGGISQELLLRVYPFYNLIATVRMTGQQIYDMVEFNLAYLSLNDRQQLIVNPDYLYPKPKHYNFDIYAGLKVYADMSQAPGQRVIDLIDDRTGQSLALDQSYRVALSQYRAVGGGDYSMLNASMIESLSQRDIASLLKEALNRYQASDWQAFKEDYQWLILSPDFELADDPEALFE